MATAREIIEALRLQPHPVEGGFFRETHRSAASIPPTALPRSYPADVSRSVSTAIYYLLTPETFSELHRLPTEEVFHVYLGGPVRMLQLHEDGSGRVLTLGTDVLRGELPQLVVPAGVWQGSWLAPGSELVLLGATVAPGFDYADYERGDRDDLIRRYPRFASEITRLTRVHKSASGA